MNEDLAYNLARELGDCRVEIERSTGALKSASTALWIALKMIDFSHRPETEALLQGTLRDVDAAIHKADPEWESSTART